MLVTSWMRLLKKSMYIMIQFNKESACILIQDTGIFSLFEVIIYVLTSNEFRQHEILTWGKIPNPLFEKRGG